MQFRLSLYLYSRSPGVSFFKISKLNAGDADAKSGAEWRQRSAKPCFTTCGQMRYVPLYKCLHKNNIFSDKGPFKCCVTIFFWKMDTLQLVPRNVKTAVGPFYLVSMPGEIKYLTHGINV